MWAAQDGHESTVELLLDRGADVEAREVVRTCLERRSRGGAYPADRRGRAVREPAAGLRRAVSRSQPCVGPDGVRSLSGAV